MTQHEKLCFVISPIGEPDSDTRKRSDQVLKHVVRPAVNSCGFKAVRADEIDKPGMITSQIIQHVVNDALVVADLTERNPNVFYELAIRHALRKPFVQIIRNGEAIPFDVAGTRTIYVDHTDLDSVEAAKNEIIKQIKALEKDSSDIETPISVSLDLQLLRQRVENDLQDIRTTMLAMRDPLLPCAVFATLRCDLRDEDVKRMFNGDHGLGAYAPGKTLPEPFDRLGISDGRLMLPFGYLDFTDGRVTAAGSFVMKHPGYNVIHCPVTHTIVRVQSDAVTKKILPNEPIFEPHLKLDFYFEGRPKSLTETPSLVLSSGMDSSSVLRASAFDSTVFVDISVEHLTPKPVVTPWSIGDLKGAFIRATLDFHLIDGLHDYSDHCWPSLHNFQLWLGGMEGKLLTFSLDQLKCQVLQTNPNPVFARGAVSSQIVFECEVSEDVFDCGLLARA